MKWGICRKLIIVLMSAVMALSMTVLLIHDQKWALIFIGAIVIWSIAWGEA